MTGIKRYAFAAIALWGTLALCSCLKDDLSGCPDGFGVPPHPEAFTLRIGFENVTPEYAAEVGRMDVFIFDEEGIFYEALTGRNMSLTPGFRMQTQLPPGNYRLVSWSNLGGHYLTAPAVPDPGITPFAGASALLDITGGTTIGYDLNTFLHGERQAGITGDTLIMIPLVQNNYRINVTVEGVENNHNCTVAIADDNGSYYFDNDFAPSAALQYTRGPVSAPAGKFSASLSVLRLDRGRSPELTVTDNTAGSVLVRENLIGLILALEARTGVLTDFSTQHEFDIHIIYDQATLSASFFIDGWQIKTGKPGELG
jgi:hypothetical protein